MNITEEIQNSKAGRRPELTHEEMQEAYDYHINHNVSLRAISRYFGVSVTAVKYGIKVIDDASVKLEKSEKRQWDESWWAASR
jgi:hypothetical protein